MTERRSFYRKVGYAVAIGALLFPLAWLSSPATSRTSGGQLARLRTEHRLSQANLGEIDPASEVMKLATLGLRGVAVNWLWGDANHYKKVEDWDNLSATLSTLANLQPNFITFWKFQAWNLSYNVSVEFDDYHDRYAKVIEGIKFLQRGERYNTGNANLLSDLGWFIGQKIGRADEYVQYRRLFKADDDFHPADLPRDQRDNWLVSKEWYERGIDSVNRDPMRLGRKSPRIFFSSPAMSQINYSEAIEEEGFFDKARRAWIKATEEWKKFGETPIEHSTGVIMRLGEKGRLEKEVDGMRAKLDAMLPGVRDKVREERLSALTPEERALLALPPQSLTDEQSNKLYDIQGKITVTDRDVADRIAKDQPEQAKEALQLARELQDKATLLQYTINYRRDSNYDYWETRCDFEQTPDALAARELMYRANKAVRDDHDPPTAKKLYEQGFEKWRLVIDKFPMLLDEEAMTGEDIVGFVKKYRDVLDQFEETLPDDFPLWDVLEKFDLEQDFTEELTRHRQRGAAPATDGTQAPAATTPPAGEPAATESSAAARPSSETSPSEPSANLAPATTEQAAPAE